MECAALIQPLDPREARMVIEPYFEELQESFVEAGFTQAASVKLRCRSDMHDTDRHFAGCTTDGGMIFVAPEMVDLQPETVLGILAHELGHALDFLYPGSFLLREDHVILVEADKQRMKGWRKRDDDTVEITADLIAEYVLGSPIGYRGPCYLQSLGHFSPRPLGLR